jgi:aminocarboxymuconate-semialdehyde decarboxylase
MPAIDVHFHVMPPAFVDAVQSHHFDGVIELDRTKSPAVLFHRPPAGVIVEQGPPLLPQLMDVRAILTEMDRRKLDAAAISPPPQLFAYWAGADDGERIARTVNDGLAQMQRAHPDRFLPLASLPLQDGERAARELERACGELRLCGAALCTHVNGIDLDVAGLDPVFSAAQRLDVPLFLHPQNAGDVRRLEDYHLWNLVGFMMETATAAARLLMSGTFERYPKLKVVLAHGGGFLPYQLGRLDHGYAVRPELQARLPKPPTAYLGNIFCDALVHNNGALRFLIERIGADHVVLGSDHPFDMGSDAPVGAVRALGLPRAQEEAILGGNLARLLKVA